MSKSSPSKTLAARIETRRRENPALTIEQIYDQLKKEDPKLIAAFAAEVGFDPATTREQLISVE
jgi:hypothetical protein